MPDPSGVVTVALDFDGTAVLGWPDYRPPIWRRGARELIRGARAAGVRVVIHTCRAIPGLEKGGAQAQPDVELAAFAQTGLTPDFLVEGWKLRAELLEFLEREGVIDLVDLWEGPGKPMADFYVDDKAEGNDLVALAARLGVTLADERRGDAPVGQREDQAATAP